jgi:hypothetical protein
VFKHKALEKMLFDRMVDRVAAEVAAKQAR